MTVYRTLAERPDYEEPRVERRPVVVSSAPVEELEDDGAVTTVRVVAEEDDTSIGFNVTLAAVMVVASIAAIVSIVR